MNQRSATEQRAAASMPSAPPQAIKGPHKRTDVASGPQFKAVRSQAEVVLPSFHEVVTGQIDMRPAVGALERTLDEVHKERADKEKPKRSGAFARANPTTEVLEDTLRTVSSHVPPYARLISRKLGVADFRVRTPAAGEQIAERDNAEQVGAATSERSPEPGIFVGRFDLETHVTSQRLHFAARALIVLAFMTFGLGVWAVLHEVSKGFSPEAAVQDYIDDLVAGDVESASRNENAINKISNKEMAHAVYRPSSFVIGLTERSGDKATTLVAWFNGVKEERATIVTEKLASGPFGILQRWKVTGGLLRPVSVRFTGPTTDQPFEYRVGARYQNAPENTYSGGTVALPPGEYWVVPMPASELVDFGQGQIISVRADAAYPNAIDFQAVPGHDLKIEAWKQAEGYLSACLEKLNSQDCPNNLNDAEVDEARVKEFTWKARDISYEISQNGALLRFSARFVLKYEYAQDARSRDVTSSETEGKRTRQRTFETTAKQTWEIELDGDSVALARH